MARGSHDNYRNVCAVLYAVLNAGLFAVFLVREVTSSGDILAKFEKANFSSSETVSGKNKDIKCGTERLQGEIRSSSRLDFESIRSYLLS